jgi:Holliday junction resolvase-like predicted endonuclease
MAGMGSYRGATDMVAMKDGIVLFIEIKSKTGKQSENQIKYQKSVTDAGCHYILARGYEDIENYLNKIEVREV